MGRHTTSDTIMGTVYHSLYYVCVFYIWFISRFYYAYTGCTYVCYGPINTYKLIIYPIPTDPTSKMIPGDLLTKFHSKSFPLQTLLLTQRQ